MKSVNPHTPSEMTSPLLKFLGHTYLIISAEGYVQERHDPQGILCLGNGPEKSGGTLADHLGSQSPERHFLESVIDSARKTQTREFIVPKGFSTSSSFYGKSIMALPQSDDAMLLVFKQCPQEQSLRLQLDGLLDSTPDGIFVIDADRKVKLFNKACGEILGHDPNDVIKCGARCDELTRCHTCSGVSLASHLCPARSLFAGEQEHQCEEMLMTSANGQERWIETHYSAIKDESGKVQWVVGVLRDVHDRKILEEKLAQSQKLASLGQLIAGIAHEIKNPLAIILSSLDIIQNQSRPEEQRVEACQFLRDEVQRLDSRVRSFLSFARPRPLNRESVLLTGILRRTVNILSQTFPKMSWQLDFASPDPIINADPDQLHQVFTNIILNAVDATKGEGIVSVSTRVIENQVCVHIEDSGPGINPTDKAKIFDPFFTTRAEGTGLGLSISYQIIAAHKGAIRVDSKSQKLGGATFQIQFPLNSLSE